jgi:hypothetical protein
VAAWPTGSVKGLRARGGFEADIDWKDGKLQQATLRSLTGTACSVRYGQKQINVTLTPGTQKKLSIKPELRSRQKGRFAKGTEAIGVDAKQSRFRPAQNDPHRI